jgi:methylmalonyl-CoA carboxyltransferase large subunit
MTSDSMQVLNSGFGFIVLLVFVIIACAATYIVLQRRLKQEIAAIRTQIEHDLDFRSAQLGTETKTEIVKPKAIETRNTAVPAKPEIKPTAPTQPQQTAEELAHETLVVIAAAVSAFLGKSVRLRSARLIQPVEGSAWAQQGRVFVQASHNLGIAHHA